MPHNVDDFPRGATKGVGTTTLLWLKEMSLQDRVELILWLLRTEEDEELIRKRHAS